MLLRVQGDPVGDRARDVGRRHDGMVRVALQAAAVAAAMVDEIEPRLLRAVALRRVEGVRNEAREIRSRRRVVRCIDLRRRGNLAVADLVGFGALAGALDEVVPRGRVLDVERDAAILRTDAERLIDHRRLHGVEVVVAVAIDSELQSRDVHAAHLRQIATSTRLNGSQKLI